LLHAPGSRQWFLLLNFPLGDWTRDEFMAERRGLIDGALCDSICNQALTCAMRNSSVRQYPPCLTLHPKEPGREGLHVSTNEQDGWRYAAQL
jgi:hypothetical protein